MLTQLLQILASAGLRELVDVSIVAFLLYRVLLLIRGTQAVQVAIGVFVVAMVGLLAEQLHFELLSWLFRNAAPAIFIGIIILFQPELRRALDELGRLGRLRMLHLHYEPDPSNTVNEVIGAVERLSQRHIGALIAIERSTGLEDYAGTGVRINGELTAEFLQTIFFPNSPLHDGAVIVRGSKILSAGCLLPLADNGRNRERLGTRHRAALGLSTKSDALVVVVSEETGSISLMQDGQQLRNLDASDLRQRLRTGLSQAGLEVHLRSAARVS